MERESFKQTIEGDPKEYLESAIHSRLEGKKTLEKKRSPHEVMELKDRLRFVAKLMAKNFDLRVIPGDGWAAPAYLNDFKKNAANTRTKAWKNLTPRFSLPK